MMVFSKGHNRVAEALEESPELQAARLLIGMQATKVETGHMLLSGIRSMPSRLDALRSYVWGPFLEDHDRIRRAANMGLGLRQQEGESMGDFHDRCLDKLATTWKAEDAGRSGKTVDWVTDK